MGIQSSNIYVLKQYSTLDARKYYENETKAFHRIGPNQENIVKYYGSFTRNDIYNVILEYADKGTLKDFFERELPPSTEENIMKFWACIFQLMNGLWKIHTIDGGALDGPQIFQGYVRLF